MGLVLVFDLDQTIIDSSDPYLFNRPNTPEGITELKKRANGLLNFRLVNDVIKRAARLRGTDKITGIFLLTNNSSKIMVSAVDSVLRDTVARENPEGSIGKYKTSANKDPDTQGMPNQPYFFDSILMREHSGRTPGSEVNNPVKNLEDVKRMLGFIGVKMSDEEIRKNTFFFDDMDHPGMTLGDQYIKIYPPFKKYTLDYTHYDLILQKLSELDGKPAVRPLPKFTPVSPTLVNLRKPGRPRSGAMNNRVNNMELPLPQESTIRHNAKAKPSLFSIFKSSGGFRTRKNRRNKSRKLLRK